MTSEPKIQIAYAVLRHQARQATSLAELNSQAHQLAALIQLDDVCTSCWVRHSNGVARTCEGGECLLSKE